MESKVNTIQSKKEPTEEMKHDKTLKELIMGLPIGTQSARLADSMGNQLPNSVVQNEFFIAQVVLLLQKEATTIDDLKLCICALVKLLDDKIRAIEDRIPNVITDKPLHNGDQKFVSDKIKALDAKLDRLRSKGAKEKYKERIQKKKDTGQWLSLEQYHLKIDTCDWTKLSEKNQYEIVKSGGRFYVKAETFANFKAAIKAVVAASKEHAIPYPRFQAHPDFQDKIFSGVHPIPKEKAKVEAPPKE